MSYDALLSPFRLKHLELRNRVMMTAHVTNMAPLHRADRAARRLLPRPRARRHRPDRHGLPGRASRRASTTCRRSPATTRASCPGCAAIADAVHEHGTPIIAQLGHAGRQGNSAYTMQPLMAPSAIPCPLNREMPKAMEPEDLDEVVEGHALRRVASSRRPAWTASRSTRPTAATCCPRSCRRT